MKVHRVIREVGDGYEFADIGTVALYLDEAQARVCAARLNAAAEKRRGPCGCFDCTGEPRRFPGGWDHYTVDTMEVDEEIDKVVSREEGGE